MINVFIKFVKSNLEGIMLNIVKCKHNMLNLTNENIPRHSCYITEFHQIYPRIWKITYTELHRLYLPAKPQAK